MMVPASVCPFCCRVPVPAPDRTPPPVVTERAGDRERSLMRGVFVVAGKTVGHA